MKSKQVKSKNEKTVSISVGDLTKAGMSVFTRVLKTADDVRRSRITIKLEKEWSVGNYPYSITKMIEIGHFLALFVKAKPPV